MNTNVTAKELALAIAQTEVEFAEKIMALQEGYPVIIEGIDFTTKEIATGSRIITGLHINFKLDLHAFANSKPGNSQK